MGERLREAFSLRHDTADYGEIKERIIGGGQVTGTNLCILMMAILVASIGLNMNSTAVIIGAMLISPLMGSIQALGYGMATGNAAQVKKSGTGFLFQIIISLVTSTLYFLISPISTQTSELLARTQPNIWDVMIAICGGIAGMIGATRKEKSNVIPGVAIATALMPPLCTCGYGIAHGSLRITLGAGYLFLVNTYFIFLASVLVLIGLKVPQEGEFSAQQRKRMKRRLVCNTALMLIPCLAVAGVMVRQANVDTESVTGFETTASIQSVTQEARALFPAVEDIKIGTLESSDNEEAVTSEKTVVLYLRKDLSKEESGQIERWLNEVYDSTCNVIYIIEN